LTFNFSLFYDLTQSPNGREICHLAIFISDPGSLRACLRQSRQMAAAFSRFFVGSAKLFHAAAVLGQKVIGKTVESPKN